MDDDHNYKLASFGYPILMTGVFITGLEFVPLVILEIACTILFSDIGHMINFCSP